MNRKLLLAFLTLAQSISLSREAQFGEMDIDNNYVSNNANVQSTKQSFSNNESLNFEDPQVVLLSVASLVGIAYLVMKTRKKGNMAATVSIVVSVIKEVLLLAFILIGVTGYANLFYKDENEAYSTSLKFFLALMIFRCVASIIVLVGSFFKSTRKYDNVSKTAAFVYTLV